MFPALVENLPARAELFPAAAKDNLVEPEKLPVQEINFPERMAKTPVPSGNWLDGTGKMFALETDVRIRLRGLPVPSGGSPDCTGEPLGLPIPISEFGFNLRPIDIRSWPADCKSTGRWSGCCPSKI